MGTARPPDARGRPKPHKPHGISIRIIDGSNRARGVSERHLRGTSRNRTGELERHLKYGVCPFHDKRCSTQTLVLSASSVLRCIDTTLSISLKITKGDGDPGERSGRRRLTNAQVPNREGAKKKYHHSVDFEHQIPRSDTQTPRPLPNSPSQTETTPVSLALAHIPRR